jgi:hypothetical protein
MIPNRVVVSNSAKIAGSPVHERMFDSGFVGAFVPAGIDRPFLRLNQGATAKSGAENAQKNSFFHNYSCGGDHTKKLMPLQL